MEDVKDTSIALVPVETFKEIIAAAPAALEINAGRAQRAIAACNTLLQRIEAEGMSEELDAQCNTILVKLKSTYQGMFDQRKPLTELFDKVRKVFTDLESQLDAAKKDSIYAQIQSKRNEYATFKANEKKRLQLEAEKKLAREKELIELKSSGELHLRNGFLKQLEQSKNNLTRCFEALNLEEWEHHYYQFTNFPLKYTPLMFQTLTLSLNSSKLISEEDLHQLADDVRAGKYEQFATEYENNMVSLFNSLGMKVNSKRLELQEIEQQRKVAAEAKRKADAEQDKARKEKLEEEARKAKAEQERLAREAEERKALDEAKQLEEARLKEEQANAEAEANKQVEITNSLFQKEMELAEVTPETNAIESYEIEVKNAPAWLLIVSFYFEKEGKNQKVEALGNKKLDQMKKFCESHYKKTGEQIVSPYIVYNAIHKVQARK